MKQSSLCFSTRLPGLSARAFRGLGAAAAWITIVAASWSCSGGAANAPGQEASGAAAPGAETVRPQGRRPPG